MCTIYENYMPYIRMCILYIVYTTTSFVFCCIYIIYYMLYACCNTYIHIHTLCSFYHILYTVYARRYSICYILVYLIYEFVLYTIYYIPCTAYHVPCYVDAGLLGLQGSQRQNVKSIAQTIIPIPDPETIDTPCLRTLDPRHS